MKHLRELPSSGAEGTGRVNSPWAELAPPWQVSSGSVVVDVLEAGKKG